MLITGDTATESTGPVDAAVDDDAVRRRLEERNRLLTELSELRTEFIRVASHELRTPLTSIITFANMLEAGEGDVVALNPSDRRSALTAIRRNAERMQLLVADLLLLTHLETAEEPLDVARLDLNELLAEATGEVSATVAVPPDAELFGDRPLLRQLLRTAVDVAQVANDADKPISVTVDRLDEHWTVRVGAATAGALSAERLLSMRIPHPEHPGEHRTGALALMLGREIATRHGGEMVTSVERSGVTVRITLPCRPPS